MPLQIVGALLRMELLVLPLYNSRAESTFPTVEPTAFPHYR